MSGGEGSWRRQWIYWCELPGGGATTTMAPCLVTGSQEEP